MIILSLSCHSFLYAAALKQLNSNLQYINSFIPKNNSKIINIKRFESGDSFINDVFLCTTSTNKQYVIKIGNSSWNKVKTLNEILSIRLMSKETNIPVPKVIGYQLSKKNPINKEFIIMEKIEGVPLSLIYDKIKDKKIFFEILDHLASLLKEMRKVSFSKLGNLSLDINNDVKIIAPIEIHLSADTPPPENFREYSIMLLEYYNLIIQKSFSLSCARKGKIQNMVNSIIQTINTCFVENTEEKFVFSHQDLVMKNILVKGNKVVGIVDWEWAGPGLEEIESISGLDFLSKDEHMAYFKQRIKSLDFLIFPLSNNKLRLEILKFAGLIYRIAAFEEWAGEKEFLHTARFIDDKMFQRHIKKCNIQEPSKIIELIMKDIEDKYYEITRRFKGCVA